MFQAEYCRTRLEETRNRDGDVLRRLLGVRRPLGIKRACIENGPEVVGNGAARILRAVCERDADANVCRARDGILQITDIL